MCSCSWFLLNDCQVGLKGGNEISPEDIEVTFEDVKGCEEAKQELQEVSYVAVCVWGLILTVCIL